eukprot:gene30930-41164_t
MKLVLSLFSLFLSAALFGQLSEQHYPNGNLQCRGQYKTFRVKTTFGYDITKVKNGTWEYFYEDGNPALTSHYKAKKKGAIPKGVWEYYGTDGELLKKETYKHGDLTHEEFFTTGLYKYTTDSFRVIQLRPDTMLVIKYLRGDPYSDLLVNNGKGVYTFPKRLNDERLAYETPALADDGFTLKDTGANIIGNHSFSHHFWFDLFMAKKMLADIQQMDAELQKIVPLRPNFFRPPYGVTTPPMAKALAKGGYTAIGWNIRSMDTTATDNNKLFEKVTAALQPGAILLFHDTCKITVETLPKIIEEVRRKGYEFERLDKLIDLHPSRN